MLAGKLHLALDLRRGAYTGVLDSVDQGAKLPIENVTLDGSALRFDVPLVQGKFDGKLDPGGARVEGTWTQNGVTQPLAFTKGTRPAETKEAPKRPLDAPIDVSFGAAPVAFRAGDHMHLAYEIHVMNFAHRPITLERLEVTSGPRSLARFEGDALAHMIDEGGRVGPRSIATIFVWLDADDVPQALDHRITVKVGEDEMTVSDVRVAVRAMKVPVIAPPLRGRFWLAANGPSNASQHRRAQIPIGGHAHVAQRFAIDWVKPSDDDGKTFSGDPSKNASYHAYGAEALAVADGVVTEVKDGIPENTPGSTRAVPMTLETLGGNHVVVSLGGGLFAFWAHLQPGSLKVKVGDRVKRGQVLGLVGNSGNSTEPHLHFHVSDARSPLGAEGVPWALEAFAMHDGTKRTNQIPMEDEVVALP